MSDVQTKRLSWIQASQYFLGKEWNAVEFDCYDLVKQVYKMVTGIDLPAQPNVCMHTSKQVLSFRKMLKEHPNHWVKADALKPGVIVGLSYHEQPHHCGLYVGQQRIMHVFEKKSGVMLSNKQQLFAQGWNIVGMYTWQESQP